MSEIAGDVLGWIATTIVTIDTLPQISKIIMTNSVEDISPWSYALRLVGNILFILYCMLSVGFNKSLPVLISSSLISTGCLTVIVFFIRRTKRSDVQVQHIAPRTNVKTMEMMASRDKR